MFISLFDTIIQNKIEQSQIILIVYNAKFIRKTNIEIIK